METVQDRVSEILQDPDASECGGTPRLLQRSGPIHISPVCGSPNRHRLNTYRELTDTVLHEARHAWQNSQRVRSVGVNDDRNSKTPRNDDDLDLFVEIVDLDSAAIITEAVSGTGDHKTDPGGAERREDEPAAQVQQLAGALAAALPDRSFPARRYQVWLLRQVAHDETLGESLRYETKEILREREGSGRPQPE